MAKTLLDSFDEFNFMVVLLFSFFILMSFIIIIIVNFKKRNGNNRNPQTTYYSIGTSNIPQTTSYIYDYTTQLNQYIHPTQGFF
jgi:hypothetical protein